ncbi:hypothetical protein XELAEV_18009847mg [Xenopus laevis]|uniref:SEA domain-containing protein n=1 Tax=Xenopus laevis TaxID=8355 RepID=A0A974DVI0_XENLA|nr:hypothetical protein XELAEV_18009847mg [Xenopus laevis]
MSTAPETTKVPFSTTAKTTVASSNETTQTSTTTEKTVPLTMTGTAPVTNSTVETQTPLAAFSTAKGTTSGSTTVVLPITSTAAGSQASSTASSVGVNTTTMKTVSTTIPPQTAMSTAGTTASPITSKAAGSQASSTTSPAGINTTTIKTLSTAAPTTLMSTAVTEPPVNAVTQAPVQTVQTKDIAINCTFTSLSYSNDLGTQNSAEFNSTAADIIALLDAAFRNSTIGSKYRNCKIDNFMSASQGTKVNSICSINNETTGPQFDIVVFYGELEAVTNNVTQWGKYKLDKNSLFVNGYQKPTTTLIPTTTTKPTTTTIKTASTPGQILGPKPFFLNFTITNLDHSSTLENKDSANYSLNKNNIDKLLNEAFNKSILKNRFENCTVTAFRPTPKSPFTTTEAICIFNVDLLAKGIDNQYIKDVFLNETENGVRLGIYTLDKTSINVAGYTADQATTTTIVTTTVPSLAPGDKGYDISFTIYNDFVPSDPVEFEKKRLLIEEELNTLYRNSALSKKFKFCKVSAMRNGSIIPSCGCYFEDDPAVTIDSVRKEFFDGTKNGTLLGKSFKLNNISIQEMSTTNELPFWAIILICLAVLLGLILLFLFIFVLVFFLRKRKGSFDVRDTSIYGTYFPHLDMRNYN